MNQISIYHSVKLHVILSAAKNPLLKRFRTTTHLSNHYLKEMLRSLHPVVSRCGNILSDPIPTWLT